MPLRYRVLYTNAMTMVYDVFLSYVKYVSFAYARLQSEKNIVLYGCIKLRAVATYIISIYFIRRMLISNDRNLMASLNKRFDYINNNCEKYIVYTSIVINYT